MPNLFPIPQRAASILDSYALLAFGVVTLNYKVGQGGIDWTADISGSPWAITDGWLDVASDTWEPWTGGIFLSVHPADGSPQAVVTLASPNGEALRDQLGGIWVRPATTLSNVMLRFADIHERGMAFRVSTQAGSTTSTLDVGLGSVDHTDYDGSSNGVPLQPLAPIVDLRPPIKGSGTGSDTNPLPKPKPSQPPPNFRVTVLEHHSGMQATVGLEIALQRLRNQLQLVRAKLAAPTVVPRVPLHVATRPAFTDADD